MRGRLCLMLSAVWAIIVPTVPAVWLPAVSAQPPATPVGAPADAQHGADDGPEVADIPPADEYYLGRKIAWTMSYHGAPWLMRDNREAEERTSQVLEQLQLKPGMVVCDMGCGNGYFTLPMAEQVGPTGKVVAVDIQPEMLQLLSRRLVEAGLDNVDVILGSVVDPKLPEGEIDLLLMVDVYHEFSHPEQMLAAIRRSLKPDGVVALVEYRAEDPRIPIYPEHKMSKKQILKEYRANGFRLVRQYDGLPVQHLMFLGVDPKWEPKKRR
jgi:SAM-dependent methyltransferase